MKMKNWTMPLILLGLCLVSFALLIPDLGLYWDDWPVIYLAHTQGISGYWAFYQYDRPISAWTYLLTIPILGTTPLYWHLFSLLLRWLTVWGMWAVLRKIWPQHQTQVSWMAIIFAIYPCFFLQSISVAFSQHLITYALYFLSLLLMIRAIQQPACYWPLTLAAMLTAISHMLTMEYMVGLELIRPALLWLLAAGMAIEHKQRWRWTVKQWLPYLLLWAVFVVWRLFFFELPIDDPNAPRLMYDLQSAPLGTILGLLQTMLRDLLHVWLATWYQTLQPVLIDFSSPFGLISWGVSLVTAIATGWLMYHLDLSQQERDNNWNRQALTLGIFASLMGLLPVWFTGREMLSGMYADRFTLPAMFGASMLLVAVMYRLDLSRLQRVVLLALLVGLAVGAHLRKSNEFRWDWTKQKRYYWQMYWRAPGIEPGTALVTDSALSQYVSRYVGSVAINTFYPQAEADQPAYWYFEYFYAKLHQRIPAFLKGIKLRDNIRDVEFSGDSHNSLLIHKAGAGECIWFLTPRDIHNQEIPEEMRQMAAVANLERIQSQAEAFQPPTHIFGSEIEHSWCYYYQKADLARQRGEWTIVLDYYQQAQAGGLYPQAGYELIPFIEAHAALGEWDQAVELTIKAYQESEEASSMLCAVWQEYTLEHSSDLSASASYDQINAKLSCTSP